MVANKKQNFPAAPNMGSRTNSSQPLPRAKATSNSNPIPTAGPSPQKKPKQKKPTRSSKPTTKKSSSMVDRLMVIMLALFTTYALWSCPSDDHLSNPVCRSLSQYRTHILDPYVLPPVQWALAHPYVAPAADKFHEIERVVTPIAVRTQNAVQPYIIKTTKIARVTALHIYVRLVRPLYTNFIQPMYQKHLDPLYLQYVHPRVQIFRSRVLDPYLGPFVLKAHLYTNRAFWATHQLYMDVSPRVHAVFVRARPFVDRVWEIASPYVMEAVELGTRAVKWTLEEGAKTRRQFVDPHVIRIWEKVIELSGSTRTTASSTAFAGTSFLASTTVPETQATSAAEVESETVQSSSSHVLSATTSSTVSIVTEPSEVALSLDESSLPEETSSSEEATLTSSASVTENSDIPSPSASTKSEEYDISYSSSSVPAADSSPTQTSIPEALDIEPEIQIDDDQEPESDIFETVSSEPDLPVSTDDLDDFFADLGIMDAEEDDTPGAPVDEEQQEETALTPEESAEARRVATAKKRAELEARMDKWHLDLDGLIKRRTKAFRKELVRVRKGAVRALFPDPEKDNSDLEDALTHIRGEDVAGILDRFEKESEKLLKGLESYLKKEEKLVSDSSGVDVDDRMKRWYNVVQRVEERFIERINGLQEKVHWWYLEVRELEVQEYHRATKEVKTFAQKAQGDMGMPMAWLDDVTYQDWQRYHDLIRAHERFDEQIRMIQNGTHPSPPIDPLVPALDKLQMELEDVKAGFDSRIRTLSTQIHSVLSPPEKEDVADSFVDPVTSEEEEVSILPIDPVPTSPVGEEQDGFDPSSVIVGKSKEQVEEAMSIAQEFVHEEF
ncbi:hypothetical protein FB446DRAFT_716417 [Lentinula raphanica]|nr:hypothetical protein FB446DRAFT_716417 [Lentinula raphanica]